MRGALSKVLEFLRELDRGMAMMRGEVMPGTYDRRRRLRGCWRSRRCERGTAYTRRNASVRRKNERFGE